MKKRRPEMHGGIPSMTPRRGTPRVRRGRGVRALFAAARAVVAHLLLVGVAGGAVAGTWLALTRSPALAIKTIAVEGTSPERGDEIRALLDVKPGDNLLFADLASARTRAQTHPWVATALVKRELPDTLRIVVTERVPRMVLSADRLYYVDAAGQPFKAIVAGDKYDLPVLTGLAREDLLARPDVARGAIAGALDLLAAIEKDGAGALSTDEISEVGWDEDTGYTVRSIGGRKDALPALAIRFGNGDWADKLARLREVRGARHDFKDGIGSVDLTYAAKVIVAR